MGDLNWAMPAIDGVFWAQLGQIMLINLILSGDNAVIIALAVNKLEPVQKKWGIILGSGLAVVLRIILTGFAVVLLTIPFLKVVGGILILWIAVKLFAEGHEENVEAAGSLKAAVWTILVADLVMSIDNVLAVAGAANGGMVLIIIGLVTSIPIVIFGSTLLSALMQKFPIIITIGAMILGKVGGEMIITDSWVHNKFHPSKYVDWGFQIFFALAVVAVGKLWMKRSSGHKAEGSEG
ncbi:MAG: TerC family protein [Syntrophorhabdaceae bacterium]|nr:TerC family protein [Syntrophorhabdaceae bacterium]